MTGTYAWQKKPKKKTVVKKMSPEYMIARTALAARVGLIMNAMRGNTLGYLRKHALAFNFILSPAELVQVRKKIETELNKEFTRLQRNPPKLPEPYLKKATKNVAVRQRKSKGN